MGDHSFLSIESIDFHNMIHILRKDVMIPSADTLKKDIINIYKDNFKKISHNLQVSKLIVFVFLLIFLFIFLIFYRQYLVKFHLQLMLGRLQILSLFWG